MKQQDIEDLRQLIEFLKHHGCRVRRGPRRPEDPSQIQSAGGRFGRVERLGAAAAGQRRRVAQAAGGVAGGIGSSPAVGRAGRGCGCRAALGEVADRGHVLWLAVSPGASPFVSPGDHVEKGQVICIIEAMKLMNEIESDAAGEVVKCLVTNGQPIEFGQPLFSIRTA
jgi:acetyl-CoA carboxylase biotin carboxyl carrier protein